MKFILIVGVLLFVEGCFAQESNQSEGMEAIPAGDVESSGLGAEEENEPLVGVKKASPSLDNYRRPPSADYYRPPPCAKSFMFSCQPIVRAVGCSQGYQTPSYLGAPAPTLNYAPVPQQNTKRLQRCSLPQQISYNPVIRAVY